MPLLAWAKAATASIARPAASMPAEMTDAEMLKVDKESQKITGKHGEK